MKKILLFGAGRSASVLIEYLEKNASIHNWMFTIADAVIPAHLKESKNLSLKISDINNVANRKELISSADVVISLLPPSLHLLVAHDCISFSKHLLTASYLTPEIEALNQTAIDKEISIVMEMGLDPGIDHMSAMKEINYIKEQGGKILSFKSYTGGLIAPESDNNPWKYKVTWNPRNVVLAGQGSVKYLDDNQYKYIPYHQLFSRTESVNVDGYESFEAYANRDSLKYIHTYGLSDVSTFLRGTLRMNGFSKAWNLLVQLGMTDDSYTIESSQLLTYRDFTKSFLPTNSDADIQKDLSNYLGISADSEEMEKLIWLGLFENKKIEIQNASPAQILQKIIEEKWKLSATDKDMIVMQHQFKYLQEGIIKKTSSTLIVKGDDGIRTAMAKTVGLPLGIIAKLILENKIKIKGVLIPTFKEIYEPVLNELESFGIVFTNKKS